MAVLVIIRSNESKRYIRPGTLQFVQKLIDLNEKEHFIVSVQSAVKLDLIVLHDASIFDSLCSKQCNPK